MSDDETKKQIDDCTNEILKLFSGKRISLIMPSLLAIIYRVTESIEGNDDKEAIRKSFLLSLQKII